MQTRSKAKILNLATKYPLNNIIVPTRHTQALQDPIWRDAMAAEFNALVTTGTWDLVPPESSKNIVGCKWIFRVKFKSDGSVERHKARLVAKGFHQRPGIDFFETYSPVIKPVTIRLVLSIAISRGWSINQLDVNNAFLHGDLSEEVFMAQPPGFVDQSQPHHICRLRKSLYGLKQAPRVWYQSLSNYLLSLGFTQTISDASLFAYNHGGVQMFVLIYVDDIIITGSSDSAINTTIDSLADKFSLKNLGELHYFLGVQIHPCANGILLSQKKYIQNILEATKMDNAKPICTPMLSSSPPDTTAEFSDPSLFRQVIGSLQYLQLTRPDLAFAVNHLAQRMNRPTDGDWTALKRVLRYLKGTIDFGLFLPESADLSLRAFSDSD